MTTELQGAPAIGVAEITEFEDNDVPDMICHLYNISHHKGEMTLCGIPVGNDVHVQMHENYKDSSFVNLLYKGEGQCPVCGARICPTCAKLG